VHCELVVAICTGTFFLCFIQQLIYFQMKSKDSTNKTKYALVTGATSGIGYELAMQLASDGYNLILVARDEGELKKVSRQFGKFSIEVKTIAQDLSEENAAQTVYDAVRSLGISVDVLINDAGQGQYGKFIETDLSRQMEIIHLNVNSLVGLTYFFLNDMISRNEGRIMQVGSEVSKAPTPLLAVYAATKAFVLSFTEALVNEIKDTNVTMTLLMPGATDTDFFDKAEMEDTKIYREGKLDSPEEVAKIAYKALQKGDRRVIGPAGKTNVAMATVTPDNMVAKKNRKTMEPSDENPANTRKAPAHPRSRAIKEKAKKSKLRLADRTQSKAKSH
jgi:short-subunit dehydrogenase